MLRAMLRLMLEVAGTDLRVGIANRSKQPVTVVTLPRYLTVEIKDARGQFVGGDSVVPTSFPSRSDYRTIGANQVDDGIFELPISISNGSVRIGDVEFKTAPATAEVRVTYKADRVMPNLSSSQRRSFFHGPLQSSVAITLG